MPRYLMFSFANYYPCGGVNDLQGAFDSIVDCMCAYSDQNANILDTHTMQKISVPRNLSSDQLLNWAKSQDDLRLK